MSNLSNKIECLRRLKSSKAIMASAMARSKDMNGESGIQVDLAAKTLNELSSEFKRFHIPADEVNELLRTRFCSKTELLQAIVSPSSKLARSPISKFNVGAAGITPSGDIYVGVNLEFIRMPLNNCVHAEQFLIANLRRHGETLIEMIAVNAAPCGHCRQFLSELACADSVQFIFRSNAPCSGEDAAAQISHSLADLLPLRFKPQDLLGDDPPPLLLQPQKLSLNFTPGAAQAIEKRTSEEAFGQAAAAALAEAKESYAPYSHCPAGVAIVTNTGNVYGGAYLESAAYNPSMHALQTAITDAVIDHMPCYTQVREVVVVEKEGGDVHHAPYVRFLMNGIAPEAVVTELTVY